MRLMFIAVLLAQAAAYGEQFFLINTCETGYHETFDCFEGTYLSLTNGFSVYKEYRTVMTNGDLDFRGVCEGGVTAGGCYSLQTASNNRALGFQPTDTKYTPGIIEMRITNASPYDIRTFSLSYDVVCLNNSDRSSSIKLEYGSPNVLSDTASSINNLTPLLKDVSPVWTYSNVVAEIKPGYVLKRGACFVIRWIFDDAGGSGARDEYGIDNIKITARSAGGTVIYIY